MKRKLFPFLMSVALGALVSGCVQSHRGAAREQVVVTPSRTVVVTQEPPLPRVETPGRAPDEAHAWVPGYWTFTNNRWVWIPGHWEVRPRATAVWVPGKWDPNPAGRGWVWTPGHWE